jgi:hypothetical protein
MGRPESDHTIARRRAAGEAALMRERAFSAVMAEIGHKLGSPAYLEVAVRSLRREYKKANRHEAGRG